MANHTYQPIVVTGIRVDENDEGEILPQAHRMAVDWFGADLVSPLSPCGHNFFQSFCVFPSGSGNERQDQVRHREAVKAFSDWLRGTDLEYAAVHWDDDHDEVRVTYSHADRLEALPSVRSR